MLVVYNFIMHQESTSTELCNVLDSLSQIVHAITTIVSFQNSIFLETFGSKKSKEIKR